MKLQASKAHQLLRMGGTSCKNKLELVSMDFRSVGGLTDWSIDNSIIYGALA